MTIDSDIILQICTSSISLIASSIIMIMIAVSSKKFSTPYRRIIFGLSAGDAFQSLAFLTGPFFVPVGTRSSKWIIGNIGTCNFNGFILVYGSSMVCFYMLMLSLYFYFKIVKNIPLDKFYNRIERTGHILIHSFLLVFCITALVMKLYNSYRGGLCYFARYPRNCWSQPETVGECTRGEYGFETSFLLHISTMILCCITIFVVMILLCIFAVKTEKLLSMTVVVNDDNETNNNMCRISCCNCNGLHQRQNETDFQYRLRMWRREVIKQATLYVANFLIIYPVVGIGLILISIDDKENDVIFLVETILYQGLFPLMGLFNMIIYTRPKVKIFRRTHPEFSWLRSFALVVKAGGEVPDENENRRSANNNEDGFSDLSSNAQVARSTSLSGPSRISNFITSIVIRNNNSDSQ